MAPTWWNKLICWKRKHWDDHGYKGANKSSSLLETQEDGTSPDPQSLRIHGENKSSGSSFSEGVSISSSKRLTMRRLSNIKTRVEDAYTGKFDFKTGYEHEFKTLRMLGRGAFGSVFLAQRRSSLSQSQEKEVFAVKRIKKDLLKVSGLSPVPLPRNAASASPCD